MSQDLQNLVGIYRKLFTIPIVSLVAAALLSPLISGSFIVISAVIVVAVSLVLVFHEEIFSNSLGTPDPIPENALSGYLSLGMLLASAGLAIVTVEPDVFSTLLPTLPASGGALAFLSIDSLPAVVTGLLWLGLLPIGAGLLYGYIERNRIVGKILMVVSSSVLLGAIIFFLSQAELDVLSKIRSIQVLTFIQIFILFVSGLITFAVFSFVIRVPADVLINLSRQGNIWFTVPIGVSIADLATVAQGYSGLATHYPPMSNLALGGMVTAALSIGSIVFFGGTCLRHGLSKKNLPHWLLAISLSLLVGCIFMLVLAEAGGLLFTQLNGKRTPSI